MRLIHVGVYQDGSQKRIINRGSAAPPGTDVHWVLLPVDLYLDWVGSDDRMQAVQERLSDFLARAEAP